MKTLRTLFVIAIAVFTGFSVKAQSSVSKNGTANAKVLSILTLAAENTLEFGSFATTGAQGSITIDTDGGVTHSDVTYSATGTHRAASFTVGGQKDFNYSISFESGVVLKKGSGDGAPTMAVSSWTAKPASKGADGFSGTLGVSGDTFTVGATLTVGASQDPGDYQGLFAVTVDYE